MAHVKVVRRSMRPEEWTDLRFVWLQRGIYEDKFEITDLEIRDARQISEDQYEYYSDEYRPLKKDDMYFTPDGTAFIRGHVQIPAHMKGKNIYFTLHTAAEMIVKINGKYVGGVDPNRERILLNPYIDSDDLTIEIEAYNRSKPDDERNPASLAHRGCRQIFEGAYLATIRDNVQSLVYDYILFMDIAHSEYFNEDYRKFLFRELSKALDFIDFDTYEGVDQAAEYVEKNIYSNTDFKGSGDVALVGHSHLDIAYYWRRIHAVHKNARTILIQLRLMDQYPEFKYTHTQAYTYETLEKYYPELFAELKEKIAAGQFEPVGAMYVEPDCNVPSAESLIRQCLYGQMYFRKAFGRTIDNAWLPDVFGNSWILPQILKKSGVDYFVSNKMSTWNDTNRFPHNNFIWKGIDGSSVYACVPPTHFITWNMPSQIQENWEAYQDKETGGQTLNMYGYGDGGSGCTEEMLEMIRRFDKVSVMPKIEVTGGDAFLHKNLKDNTNLATWDGELYLEMHRGTFTTKSNLKKANRTLEFKLRETELRAALASLTGTSYPSEELTECYKKFLLNQFHDILPGSAIHEVYEVTKKEYEELLSEAHELIGERTKALAGEGDGITVFNTLGFTRDDVVRLPEGCNAEALEDANGVVYPVQHTKDGAVAAVKSLPSKGSRVYKKASMPKDTQTEWYSIENTIGNKTLETPFYTVVFDENGMISRLYDKKNDREVLKEGQKGNRMVMYEDKPMCFDNWDIDMYYTEKGWDVSNLARFEWTDLGPVSVSLEIERKISNSLIRQKITFYADSAVIRFDTYVDWKEHQHLLKVHFPVDLHTDEATFDIQFGNLTRKIHRNTSWDEARFESCGQKWMDMSEGHYGVSMLNDCKYGHSALDGVMTLTLIKSGIEPNPTADQEEHTFTYALYPHAEGWRQAKTVQEAMKLNQPALSAEGGCAGDETSFVWIDKQNVIIETVKEAEDGDGVIIRLYESENARTKAHISFEKPVASVESCDCVEKTKETVCVAGDGFDITIKPYEIQTYRVRF